MDIDEIVEYAGKRDEEERMNKPKSIGPIGRGLAAIGFLVGGAGVANSITPQEISAKDAPNPYEELQNYTEDMTNFEQVYDDGNVEIYISPRRRKVHNWDHVNDKALIKKWKKYAQMWDIVFKNNGPNDIVLEELLVEPLTGKKTPTTIKNEVFHDWYGPGCVDESQIIIPAGGLLFASDDGYITEDRRKQLKYTYFGEENNTGKKIELPFVFNLN